MKFVIQRVREASVVVEEKTVGAIEKGFLVLIGVQNEDTKEIADKMVKKLIGLRIFEDENGKTNLALNDVNGSLLLISQFTLYADCRKGNRPSFINAGAPDMANDLYEYIIERCKESVGIVEQGVFGADMKVSLVNDGPFTIVLDSEEICKKQESREMTEKMKKPLIALSFDDGPNLEITPLVLDILEEYQIPASFFVIGNNIKDETIPVMKRALALGCEIENHSWNHAFMNQMTAEQIKEEVVSLDEKIIEITGRKPMFFRPPFIAVNDTMYENIDYPFICGIGCNDWMVETSVEERVEITLKEARDGMIVLLHDMLRNINTVEAMKIFVPELLKRGFEFVTVAQMFAAKGVDAENPEKKLYSVIE